MRERLVVSANPHMENARSLGVDVPVIDNHSLLTLRAPLQWAA